MTLRGVEVPLLLAVLGLFVAVRTLFLVRRRRTAVRRPAVPLLPRPGAPDVPLARVVDLRTVDRPLHPRAGRRRAVSSSRTGRPPERHRPSERHHRSGSARPSRAARQRSAA